MSDSTSAPAALPQNAAAVAAPPVPAVSATGMVLRPLPLVPENINDLYRIAEAFSKADCVPGALKGRPNDILVVLMNGNEMGLSPAASLRLIYVIEGKPVMAAELMVAALIFRLGVALEKWDVVERTDLRCVIQAKRKNRKLETIEWTMQMAERALLTTKKGPGGGPSTWIKYPRNMLYSRAAGEMCRFIAPDLFAGFLVPDEADEVIANARAVNAPPGGTHAPAPHGRVVDIASLQQPAPAVTLVPPQEHAQAAVGQQEAEDPTASHAAQAKQEPSSDGPSQEETTDALLRELEELMKEGRAPTGDALRNMHGAIDKLPESATRKGLEVRYTALKKAAIAGRAP